MSNPNPLRFVPSRPPGRTGRWKDLKLAPRPPYLRIIGPAGDPEIESGRHAAARRMLNVMVALIGMVITLPLWVVIAVLIKLNSRGPVFHTQIRVGVDIRQTRPGRYDPRRRRDIGGRPFRIYKFRTMYLSAEAQTGPVWARPDDPRVTAVGRFLRGARLDELPQLINVLLGDMNVVGPRPERPAIFQELREAIPDYHLRQRARPGITGLAQVQLRYDSCIEDVERKVKCDLEYIQRQSFWRDLKIMGATVPVILMRKGW
ncbi:MAG TPA: sugar transferase [Gemmatimonadales bacterium]|jgi:lipopolysaccharide/colanic/teichoic acid biosynthesis glycosyltransferase|nr:sugar transferase [Gemmatimonadales bacterium]